MSTRETKEFTTSGGHKVVYKAWLSGREFNAIQAVYVASANIRIGVDGKPEFSGVNPNVEEEATKKLIEVAVVSFDGKTDNIVNQILDDIPASEYQEIAGELQSVNSKKK